ncbi:MAG: LamG-like jellyroll fold domain-containing protein [Flavobacteriaceae bacterium]|nr:LamG-like jellyroll fold domain-containing protein [Flavobacteriaceae bacterium]
MSRKFRASFTLYTIFLLLCSHYTSAQVLQVEILGGSVVTSGSTITINAGNSIDFRITNIETNNCRNLKIDEISLSNTVDFDLSPNNFNKNVKPEDCPGGAKFLDFEIQNINPSCSSVSTTVTIRPKDEAVFTFTVVVNSAPILSVLGGSPLADVINGSTATTASNGTFFGVVATGDIVTRRFFMSNTGSCNLDLSSISSSVGDFAISTPVGPLPPRSFSISPGSSFFFDVTFTAPAATGTFTSIISIDSNDPTANPFTFTVSADIFNFNIPGPGGVTADFRLWLKSTRGVVQNVSKVSRWTDIGTNGKDAVQGIASNQPTFLDDAASNINFNPVIKFENDGSGLSQFLLNADNGFYSQDIFIVMIPDVDVTTSPGMTAFSGTVAGNTSSANYVDDLEDVTGVGFGNYTTNLSGERLWYNQGSSSSAKPFYALPASTSRAYDKAGIINTGNKSANPADGMEIRFNSVIDVVPANTNIAVFENLGSVDTLPEPDIVLGTPYIIGKNANSPMGNLNGRVAEIFTFAERVNDVDRQKIESYLAIKYGITLGNGEQANKDYINSFNNVVWNITANAGFNYHVAGIGKDSLSDLNQKQSKTLNTANEVTIGLGGIFSRNTNNPNEFDEDGDFLVWGSNNESFSGSQTNSISIAAGVTSTLTRIDRKWKIVESRSSANGDVRNVFVSLPTSSFASFPKNANEEYALVVADGPNFTDADIIDVIPLKPDGNGNLQAWYDFDGIKYFSFGKAQKLTQKRAVSISSGDYLVGEYVLNLNINAFTVMSWIKSSPSNNNRAIASKGEKLQMRINTLNELEVFMDGQIILSSNTKISDAKWHHTTFVFDSGTVFLYIDGVLDKSIQNVNPPTPNFNRFAIGVVYNDKDNIHYPFLGEIDEFSIWDVGLSANQVRYVMNQELERFNNAGTDFINGKALPYASPSNEIGNIPWSKLRAYYDFNSFFGTTVEGLTDARNFLRINYLSKPKVLTESQTLSMPYVSQADGNWADPNTWGNNPFQDPPNSLSLDGSTFINWNIVETHHNITSGNKNITVLGLINADGTLSMANPLEPLDENNSGQGLTVTHYLEIDGVIDLVGESQLVQTEGSILDEDSGGYIERDQQGTANSYNYNYWTSSVSAPNGNTTTRGSGVPSTNANFTISNVLFDGTLSNSYVPLNFRSAHTAADSNSPSTPRTLSTFWMFSFYGMSGNIYGWKSINQNSPILPAEGYTMKGTSGSADISNSQQNYVFKGKPYNGNILIPLVKNPTTTNPEGNVDRLVGNPYPSAIDATEFILDNLSIANGGNNENGTIINGALYFWDHFGEQNSHNLKDYVGGYATRNLLTGVAAISSNSRINNTSNNGGPAIGTMIPGPFIPVNQGFFVSTTPTGNNNDNGAPILSVDGGNIVFKNSQRVFVRESVQQSVFTRAPQRRTVANSLNTSIQSQDKLIRLVYESPTGLLRQIALGIHEKATPGFDVGFDAYIADQNKEDMYWLLDTKKLVIQGVYSFDDKKEFPLGLVVNQAGKARIKLDVTEGTPNGINLFIVDHVTEEVFAINDKPFEISLEPGIYENRFALLFQPPSSTQLTVSDIDSMAETPTNSFISIQYYEENQELAIDLADEFHDFHQVALFDVSGQKIYNTDIKTQHLRIPVKKKRNIYILRFSNQKGFVTRKFIVN